jgi:hypothetical protein
MSLVQPEHNISVCYYQNEFSFRKGSSSIIRFLELSFSSSVFCEQGRGVVVY